LPKFRKKPVIIEAEQLTKENLEKTCDFISDEYWGGIIDYPDRYKLGVYIKTLEGNMEAQEYDYIIKGVNDEFYPCKPDIFEKTYELVEE